MAEPHYKEYIRQIRLSRKRIRLGYCDVMKYREIIMKYIQIYREPVAGIRFNSQHTRRATVDSHINLYHGHCRDDV